MVNYQNKKLTTMKDLNPFLATDGYKTSHEKMYPEGTTLVYSNFTPRSGKHANVENSKGVISFGQQMVVRQIYTMFRENFFGTTLTRTSVKKMQVLREIQQEYSTYLGYDYDISHIRDLWGLGYLPVEIKSLPEGTFVPYGVPVLTIVNTKPEFFWLTNFLETLISNLMWSPMTAATTAYDYKKTLLSYAKETDENNIGVVDFQGHNFGMRGMAGLDATIYSGLGHATSFLGDDSLPTIAAARKYYDEEGPVVFSVPATEHSVMCAGSKDDEISTFRYLMEQFPTGILSIVSDTWDLWKVITKMLPELKEEILARDGKIVIRPDSGDPVDIICGTNPKSIDKYKSESRKAPEAMGVIELLWSIFGGTTNEQGYKVLDSHIGCIYGDSITPLRAKQICEKLKTKGFATTNIVLGIGSFTYQFVTRDTHGFACKATYVEIDGKGREIFKDPVTDDGTKKSAKGLLAVYKEEGEYLLGDQVHWEEESFGCLQTIFKNGEFYNKTTLTEIRDKISKL